MTTSTMTKTIHQPVLEQFVELFGDRVKTDAKLSRYTSVRVGGPAELFVTVRNVDELETAVNLAYAQRIAYFVLGGGSNILVADEGMKGLVVLNRANGIRFRHIGAKVICTVESGMNLSTLARQCVNNGLAGLEWAIGIPGTVGGAVVGNAGAHGGDIDDILRAATIWEPGRGARIFSNDELKYGYRDSLLKREQGRDISRRVVLSAEFELVSESVDVLAARADAFNAQRKQSQPGGATSGSMFKNPANFYAGYLIDSAELRGTTVGGAKISEKHANFFINTGEATAEDIRELVAQAWNTVRDEFNIEMELEVEMVGEWNLA